MLLFKYEQDFKDLVLDTNMLYYIKKNEYIMYIFVQKFKAN